MCIFALSILCLFSLQYAVRTNITGIRSSVNGAVDQELYHEGMLLVPEFTPQLKLTCEAYGIPSPEVTWLKDDVALQNLPGRRVITVEDGGPFGELGNLTRSTLILSEVQLSDAGEYTCRATSGNVSFIPGTTAWTFMFNVTGELLILARMRKCCSSAHESTSSPTYCKYTKFIQVVIACIMYNYMFSVCCFLLELNECNSNPCFNEWWQMCGWRA